VTRSLSGYLSGVRKDLALFLPQALGFVAESV
jgi:hypothetical protein